MNTPAETERIRQVYAEYQQKGLSRTRWTAGNAGNRAILAERSGRLKAMLERRGFFPLGQKRILDVGCGRGQLLAQFIAWGATPDLLEGIDLQASRIAEARAAHPEIRFQVTNAETLPYTAEAFDLIAVFTVFSSILEPAMAAKVAAEIQRVLKPGGAVLWYDFYRFNPINPNVRRVRRRDIARWFPGFTLWLEPVTLLPPLARRLGPLTPWLYSRLVKLRWLRTHYLGLLHKRPAH